MTRLWAAIEQASLPHAGRGPGANNRLTARGQAAFVHFQSNRGDVLLLDVMVATHALCVLQIGVEQYGGRRVNQIKNATQVDGEALLALAHEHLDRHAAALHGHAVDVFVGIRLVLGRGTQRFLTDVVHRFGQRSRHQLRAAFAAIAAHHGQAVAFVEVQVGIVDVGHLAGLDQRDRHRGIADGQWNGLEGVLEAELESDVFLGVAVVVHMDLIQRVGVHREIVGAAVRALQRLVVGNHRHEVGTPTGAVGTDVFVAAKHVQISTVDLGHG